MTFSDDCTDGRLIERHGVRPITSASTASLNTPVSVPTYVWMLAELYPRATKSLTIAWSWRGRIEESSRWPRRGFQRTRRAISCFSAVRGRHVWELASSEASYIYELRNRVIPGVVSEPPRGEPLRQDQATSNPPQTQAAEVRFVPAIARHSS